MDKGFNPLDINRDGRVNGLDRAIWEDLMDDDDDDDTVNQDNNQNNNTGTDTKNKGRL